MALHRSIVLFRLCSVHGASAAAAQNVIHAELLDAARARRRIGRRSIRRRSARSDVSTAPAAATSAAAANAGVSHA